MTTSLSGLLNRSIAQRSIGTAPSCRFQAGALPVLTSLDKVRPQRIAFDIPQDFQIVLVRLLRFFLLQFFCEEAEKQNERSLAIV